MRVRRHGGGRRHRERRMARGMDVDLPEVSDAAAAVTRLLDLTVLGRPSHSYSHSRPGARADTVRQGGPTDRAPVAHESLYVAVAGPLLGGELDRSRRLGYHPADMRARHDGRAPSQRS